MCAGISLITAEIINYIHSCTAVSASQITYQCVCRIIITDCYHGIQVGIYAGLSILSHNTVIILINSSHDIKLDQTCCLHSGILDGSFGIFLQVTYIYGPGSIS